MTHWNHTIKDRQIDELIPASYNPRQISVHDFEALKKSLQTFDAVEPAIINMFKGRKNIIISGHQRIKGAKALGWQTFPCIEVEVPEDKERELNIRMNRNTGEFDWELLANNFEVDKLLDWGFLEEELLGGVEPDEDEDKYTRNIEPPTYEPKERQPEIEELFDLTKPDALLSKIDAADITDEQKNFLKLAAYRHIVFRYDLIADYYAHASKEVQELMEDSALVIIDFHQAIENGFVQLTQNLGDIYNDEYGE